MCLPTIGREPDAPVVRTVGSIGPAESRASRLVILGVVLSRSWRQVQTRWLQTVLHIASSSRAIVTPARPERALLSSVPAANPSRRFSRTWLGSSLRRWSAGPEELVKLPLRHWATPELLIDARDGPGDGRLQREPALRVGMTS